MSFQRIEKKETLAEKVCNTIKEAILQGEFNCGDPLPTEPELEKQFGVSRMVVRDAVRMLKTQGLIDVIQGKGMFVAQSKMDSFNDALLTYLRREKASAWDIEEFELLFFPQVIVLAAEHATPEELEIVRKSGKEYLKSFKEWAEKSSREGANHEKAQALFQNFIYAILQCTHNKMVILIGQVLNSLRKWRMIEDRGEISLYPYEKTMVERLIQAIESKDPNQAAALVDRRTSMDRQIISILKDTPVGTSPQIPAELFYKAFISERD